MSVKVGFTPAKSGRATMAMIYVKTRPDRRVFFEGKEIPNDKFVAVPDNAYIRRLIKVHEDLEAQDKPETKPAKE
jgi:hypothetical protein